MKDEFLQNTPKFLSPLIHMALELGVNYQEFDYLIRQAFITEVKSVIKKTKQKSNRCLY